MDECVSRRYRNGNTKSYRKVFDLDHISQASNFRVKEILVISGRAEKIKRYPQQCIQCCLAIGGSGSFCAARRCQALLDLCMAVSHARMAMTSSSEVKIALRISSKTPRRKVRQAKRSSGFQSVGSAKNKSKHVQTLLGKVHMASVIPAHDHTKECILQIFCSFIPLVQLEKCPAEASGGRSSLGRHMEVIDFDRYLTAPEASSLC